MKPLLFTFFGIPFPSYPVFFALGFMAAFVYGYLESRRAGLDGNKVLDVGFWLFIGVIIGARAAYIIIEWDLFAGDYSEIYRIWNGGLVLYGGYVGGTLGSYLAIKFMRMSVGAVGDVLVQAGALGVAIGRLGCLFNGCCYGHPSDLPWSITFTSPMGMARAALGVPLHPAQVYEIIMLLCIFAVLLWLGRHKRFDGQAMWAFFVLYPLGRFIVEFYRGDPRGWVEEPILSRIFAPLLSNQAYSSLFRTGFIHEPYLSTSQILSVFALAIAVGGYLLARKSISGKQIADSGQ